MQESSDIWPLVSVTQDQEADGWLFEILRTFLPMSLHHPARKRFDFRKIISPPPHHHHPQIPLVAISSAKAAGLLVAAHCLRPHPVHHAAGSAAGCRAGRRAELGPRDPPSNGVIQRGIQLQKATEIHRFHHVTKRYQEDKGSSTATRGMRGNLSLVEWTDDVPAIYFGLNIPA